MEIDGSKVSEVCVFTLTPPTDCPHPNVTYRCCDFLMLMWPLCCGGRT
jgi:hypothetical protein